MLFENNSRLFSRIIQGRSRGKRDGGRDRESGNIVLKFSSRIEMANFFQISV